MTSSKSTKRALLTSVLALLMCVTMLVGATFAWFTDTASTAVNKIQAGNLKVGMEYKNAENGTFTSVTEETKVFNNEALWEPGHVEYAVLKVKNEGNLALKYKLGVNIASEKGSTNVNGDAFKLSDYINFAVVDGDKSNLDRAALVAAAGEGQSINKGYSKESHLDTTDASETVTLVVWMPETVGNEANHATNAEAPEINLGVNVAATQKDYESDSFDNTYDKNATYPTIVQNTDTLNDAITKATDGKANVKLPKDTEVTLDNGIAHEGKKSRNVTITGNGDTSVVDVVSNATGAEGGQLNYQRGSTFTFENLKVKAGEGNYDGIVCDELVYKNCTITGKLTLYGKATFINCTFENTMSNPNQYSIWTWGGTDVKFDKCTFNTNGKAILLYGQATAAKPTNLTVNNCTFKDRNKGTAGKAAIEVGNDYNATYNLVVNKATVKGFADGKNTGSTLWANKNSMDAAHLSVTIDGKKVQ